MIGYYNYTVILTYLGLTSGVFGIYSAICGKTFFSVFFLMLAGFFDMFDGMVARTRERTENEKRFGIQIDSLSDLVCFGVLPTLIVNSLFKSKNIVCIIVYVIYILAALIRLAYFNVMEEARQQVENKTRKEYEGLPVTSIALILPLVYAVRRFIGKKLFPIVILGTLLIVAILFLLKFTIKKPKKKELIALLILGILELALIILFRIGCHR